MEVAYASARDRIGTTLCGKYFLDEVLGVGGTAVVFRATHRNGNRVAVKLLHDHLCKSRDVTRRFMREAYLANLLEHPGTVRVLDDDTDENGVAFLVLELLEGETLEERRVRLGGRLAGRRGARLHGPPARGPRARAREEHRPPRHQAVEPVPDEGRRAEGARLRHRANARRARCGNGDEDRSDDRNARVHAAGAGALEAEGDRQADGHLGGRRDDVHAALR